MELKEWLKKNQNWITFSLIFLFVIWYRSSNDKSGSTNSITVPTSGLIITGAQNFQTMDVSCSKIILYIKPTP